MIIDLPRFIAAGRPTWTELEHLLDRMDADAGFPLDLEKARRLDFLYQKVSSDLARLTTFASEPALRRYLESLTARAYAEIHETRTKTSRFPLWKWLARDFPAAFQRHARLFRMTVLITLLGCAFGGVAVMVDSEAKEAILPFSHLMGDPNDRVFEEEHRTHQRNEGQYASFSTYLMSNNIHVSIMALAFGVSWGIGTMVLLFYNGVILGAIAIDYLLAGQTVFLLGWLLPHGVIEIPAILIAGQAGLLLGRTLIGRGTREPLSARLRSVGPDLCLLILGVSAMLVWAGMIESFVSQFHAPVLPYALKIGFGCVELTALVWFLNRKLERKPGE